MSCNPTDAPKRGRQMDDRGSRSESRGVSSYPGMGWYYRITGGCSDMGPEERYQRSTDPEYGVAGPEGERRTGTDGADIDRDRDDAGSSASLDRDNQGTEGMILGRFYRLIFGGLAQGRNHEHEVREAHARVSRALDGLDHDVLVLMRESLKPDLH